MRRGPCQCANTPAPTVHTSRSRSPLPRVTQETRPLSTRPAARVPSNPHIRDDATFRTRQVSCAEAQQHRPAAHDAQSPTPRHETRHAPRNLRTGGTAAPKSTQERKQRALRRALPPRAPRKQSRWLSGVYRHSNRHAPRNIPKAQYAFKVLMIHWILQFALRIAFRCVLHR